MYSEKPKLHARQKAHRPGTLRTIALDVTPRCNMKCAHCYAETFSRVEPVPLAILARALDEAYDLGVFHYVLQGGEPLTDPGRLEAILKACHPDETYLNVVSNGWAVNRDKIRRLRDLKVDKICFSLDSGIASEHDANRLPGSHARVLKAIDEVIEAGLLTLISVVVTHETLYSEGFQRAFAFALEKKIRVDAQIAEPVGNWDGRRDVLITPDDARFIKELQRTGPVLPNGQRMVNRDVYTGGEDHCPAGTEFMGITADGQVLPCNFLQFSLGNIREKTIREMRQRLLESPWFDGHHPVCLCGEDDAFIRAYIEPYRESPKPLDAETVFFKGGNT